MASALALVPFLVAGQTSFGTITITVGGQQTFALPNTVTTMSGALVPDCTKTLTATWTAALTGTPCSAMDLWITSDPDCNGTPSATDHLLPSVQQGLILTQKTGTVDFTVADMVSAGSDAGTFTCGSVGHDTTFVVCAGVDMNLTTFCQTGSNTRVSTSVNATVPTAAQIIYDTLPPGTPTINPPIEGLDTSLGVSFTAGNPSATSDFFNFDVSTDDGGTWSSAKTGVSASVSSTTITGLQDGTTYLVRMFAVDVAGNQSGFSTPVPGTPQASSGFWGAYRADGGGAQGCSAAPGAIGAGLLLLLASLWIQQRRRS
jgi:uncharacterized protein (TIGR03382 family)